ncbi:MAG: AAA family ATPase [Phycisphaerales bacterium]|nr:AAA family ATPase [Phycisphaerales bacterium]
MSSYPGITIAPDRTHHLRGGQPFYERRFTDVLSFHEPGLAAVADNGVAYHINILGEPAYERRFIRTFGFYEERAAVHGNNGWHHIVASGKDLYSDRYFWCGNFQGGRATVRDIDGLYFHLRPDGRPAYTMRHLYAGDYRDGIGCVRRQEDGRCIHIDPDGKPIHGYAYLDLDVFHKGLARARDQSGWCHVGLDGVCAYKERFASVEPFYNGKALCEMQNGLRVIVDETGHIEHTIWDPLKEQKRQSGKTVFVVGNIGAGKSTVAAALHKQLGWPLLQIDDYRTRFSDGSAAGELAAWAAWTRELQIEQNILAEFSGSGAFTYLVQHTLKTHRRRYLLLWIQTDVDICESRLSGRTWSTPYPDFGLPISKVVHELDQRLAIEFESNKHWPFELIKTVNGNSSPLEVAKEAVILVNKWLASVDMEPT